MSMQTIQSHLRREITENARGALRCHRQYRQCRGDSSGGGIAREYYHLRRAHLQLAHQARTHLRLLEGLSS